MGWGSLPQVFEENNAAWADEFRKLYETLSPEEYEAARASVLNAHYTSPTVIKAMYAAIEKMGFRMGNILEPSCGVGNFFGLLPESMAGSRLYGVELDSLTGRIAKQLYQNANIAIQGYEATSLPDSFFDVAIGNVPFGDYGVADKRYDKNRFLIHDYFFAKTLDKVRPGGIVAFVTSSGTMDKKNPTGVKHIAVRPPGKERFVRLRSLGDSYTEEAIKQRILKQRAPERPLKPVPPKIVRIRVQGDFHLSKITWKGLRALYYFYLRKLRAAQKQPQGKASYLLREDLWHLDELDEQSRFLFRHGINTAEQLTDYRALADAQIKSLYSERKTLHNEQRRHDVPEARMVEIRARIAAISAQAKPLRRSMKLCDAIMERALVLAEKQAQIKQMEKEEKGHEKKQIKDRRRAIE